MVALAFDARNIPFSEPGLPVWIGRVPVQIMRTEIKPTAGNDGQNMLVLHVRSLAGQYAGQENLIRLNLYNRSAQAVEIAQRQLSSIAHITGRMQFTDSDQLVGGQFLSVWAEQEYESTDQRTGATTKRKSCQCNDFQLLDGRSIREAMAGAAAAQPWSPNEASARPAATSQAQAFQPGPPAPATQAQPGAGTAGPQPGFTQPGPQPGSPTPNGTHGGGNGPQFSPPNGPQPGFAPPQPGNGASGGSAMGPSGFPQTQAGPGTSTAGFATSGQQQLPAAPQGGFGAPGAFPQPGQPQAGFAPPQQQAGAGPGYTPQPGGPGPWGPQ